MHKVFGIQEDVNYIDRVGAYLIPVKEGKVGVVRTTKGYFLLGGGVDSGESHEECIRRECLEEAGYNVSVGHKICSAEMYYKNPTIGYFHPTQTYYVGELLEQVSISMEDDHEFVWVDYKDLKGKMYLEMQSWAIEQCMNNIDYVVNIEEGDVLIEKDSKRISDDIVDQLIAYRKQLKLTQQDIADATGIKRANIARLELKKNEASLDSLVRYAKSMKLDLFIELVGTQENSEI